MVGFILLAKVFGQRGGLMFKYYVVQRVGSSVLLFSVLFEGGAFSARMVTASLLIKLGAAPFHQWLVEVITSREWVIVFLLIYPQKILPILMVGGGPRVEGFVLLSVIFSALGGLSVRSKKRLLGLSSVFSVG